MDKFGRIEDHFEETTCRHISRMSTADDIFP